jgi:outer membrane receptor protein involved in Fe transport
MYRTKLLSLSKTSLLGILLLSSLFLTLSMPLAAQTQTGSIKGNIKDKISGEAVIGANVSIQGGSIGSSTDIDGNFLINKVQEGTYTISITSIGYKPATIPDVKVESGKVSIIETFIEEDIKGLEAVVVTAQRETNTVVSLIREIKLAEQVAVGVSAEQISRTQDRDAAQVIRRVPGVSLVDNRFVIVRGLSQRYNAVMLNGVLTPSSEVDVKSFSFDLVPSSVIDRMLIFKSGAGELPGEFAGGIIQIYTKNVPDENFITAGISTGVRFGTTFNNVQKIPGGGLDFLGFDDGSRKIPSNFPAMNYSQPPAFNDLSDVNRATLVNQLPNNWKANSQNVSPDLRLNFAIGRRFKVKNWTVGNLTSINYSNTNQYANITLDAYNYDGKGGSDKIFQYNDNQILNNIRLGILHNWLFRINAKNSIEFKNLFNQMSFAETTLRTGQDIENTRTDVQSYSYRFESRSIYSGQLIGKHEIGERTNFNWVLGAAYTNQNVPDWRRARTIREINTTNPYALVIPSNPNPVEAGRFNSSLNETVFSATANLERKIGKSENEETASKLRIGFYTERKDRDFKSRFFGYQRVGNISEINKLPVSEAFSPAIVTGNANSLTVAEGTLPSDKYTAANTLLAGYASAFIAVNPKLSVSLGMRVEYNDQEIQSRLRNFETIKRSNPVLSPLPSVNITYDLSDKSLFRLAYAMSVNRPEFRELAPFDFYDFNLNANVIGNFKLNTAQIQNVDARWELYPSPDELISVGAFYKYFTNPIETFLLYPATGALSYTFVNSANATSYGLEIEARKSFAGVSENKFLQNLSIAANASLINSQINIGKTVEVTDPSGTVNTLDVSGVQETKRPMMNQSPYLVNVGLYYNDEKSGWQWNLLYNVFGPRIFAVGNIDAPTVYEMPRNVIDFTVTKRIKNNLEIRAGIQDILNNPVRLAQDADRNGKIDGTDTTVRSFKRGSYFTIGLSYNF